MAIRVFSPNRGKGDSVRRAARHLVCGRSSAGRPGARRISTIRGSSWLSGTGPPVEAPNTATPDRRGVHEGSEVGAGVAVVAVGARMVDDGRGLRSERHQHLLVSVLHGGYDPPPTRAKALRGELRGERADRLRRRGLWVQGEDGWPAWLPARAPH